MDRVWYFAYGSNADPDRFRDRVGPWDERVAASLSGYRIQFSDRVESEGGGGAIVVAEQGSTVYGVAYGITAEQLAAMDREEFDPSRDTEGSGRRVQVSVASDRGMLTAETYTIAGASGFRAPSSRYLGHILDGLQSVGHGPDVLADVRRAASPERAR